MAGALSRIEEFPANPCDFYEWVQYPMGIFRRFQLQQQLLTQSTLVKVALGDLFCSGPDTIMD